MCIYYKGIHRKNTYIYRIYEQFLHWHNNVLRTTEDISRLVGHHSVREVYSLVSSTIF